MKKKATIASEPEGLRQRLTELRLALLKLHKALVDSERVGYEKNIGKIQSPNHFLQLLANDSWFAWLHPLSLLIVAMDEALDAEEALTMAKVDTLAGQTKLLLVASEDSDGFPGHYFEAMQRDPDVVFAHADAAKLVNPKKSSA
jgi:hypothetical protein